MLARSAPSARAPAVQLQPGAGAMLRGPLGADASVSSFSTRPSVSSARPGARATSSTSSTMRASRRAFCRIMPSGAAARARPAPRPAGRWPG
jgi:hypothetical protein